MFIFTDKTIAFMIVCIETRSVQAYSTYNIHVVTVTEGNVILRVIYMIIDIVVLVKLFITRNCSFHRTEGIFLIL